MAAAGKRDEARQILQELFSQRQFSSALTTARIHAALGEIDEGIKWLRTACEERDPAVIWVKVDPTLDNLRADPRFTQLLKEMNLIS